MARFYIQPNGSRPDFRLVITFMWKDGHNVDTDGDSHNPASRTWTELYCQNREKEWEIIEVMPAQAKPLILEISSAITYLAARAAYFLAMECGSGISSDIAGPFDDANLIRPEMGDDFDLAAALKRAELSYWRRSTLERPYPNRD